MRVETGEMMGETREYMAEYFTWYHLVRRCGNKKDPQYKNYGGRGIKVCDRWLGKDGFSHFLEDMGPRPHGVCASGRAMYSLDRIDNNKGYSPDNCRWADHTTQSNNKRTNRQVTIGSETHTIAEWAKMTGLSWDCIHDRIEMGWPEDKILLKENKRYKMVTIQGETHPFDYWVKEYGLTRNALFFRLQKHWPEERLLEPVRPRRRRREA